MIARGFLFFGQPIIAAGRLSVARNSTECVVTTNDRYTPEYDDDYDDFLRVCLMAVCCRVPYTTRERSSDVIMAA